MAAPRAGRGLARAALLGLLVATLGLLIGLAEIVRSFELRTVDLRFKLRGPRQISTPIAAVFIGDDSVEAYGRWPWSWDYHALLIDVLRRAGARLVLFDILFAEAPSRMDERVLAHAARQAGNVHFISSFGWPSPPRPGPDGILPAGRQLIEPLAALRAAGAGVGHANAIRDADGATRRIPVAVRRDGALYPSAALGAVADAIDAPLSTVRVLPGGGIELQPAGRPPVRVPVDADGLTPVDFAGGIDSFPVRLSYRQILEADTHPGAGAVDLSVLKDRIVVVGVTFAGNADLQPTPFSTNYPMFLIQATMIDNILRGAFPRSAPVWVSFGLCLLLGAALGVLTTNFRPVASVALTLLAGGAYGAGVLFAFTRAGVLVPLIAPLAAVSVVYVLVTTAQRIEARAERQRALERLKYLGHLVESANEAIFSFDPAGAITSWNAAATRLLGWTAQEALGRDWSFVLTEAAREPVSRALASLAAGSGSGSLEVALATRDGGRIPVEIAFSGILNSAGALVGTSAISQDLTEKKKLLEVLIQSEKLAEIGRMGSGIVHEIKNPLTSIMMISDMILATKGSPEKTVKYTEIIQKESQRILRLSQNILSFARPRQSRMQAVDINEVLEDTLRLVEYDLKKGRVQAERLFDAEAPPVRGDAEKLEQVLLNLIMNATHAMPEGGQVEVRTLRPGAEIPACSGNGVTWSRAAVGDLPEGPCVTIMIADRGSGIPATILSRIFEPFFSTKGEGKGTGLGLFISHNIIAEHKGRIEVASAVGAGTVFTISLPVHPACPDGGADGANEGDGTGAVEAKETASGQTREVGVAANLSADGGAPVG